MSGVHPVTLSVGWAEPWLFLSVWTPPPFSILSGVSTMVIRGSGCGVHMQFFPWVTHASLRYSTWCFYMKCNSTSKSQMKIAWCYSFPQKHYSKVNEMWNGTLMDMETKCERHVSADEKLKLRCRSRIKRGWKNCHKVTGTTTLQNTAVHSLKSCQWPHFISVSGILRQFMMANFIPSYFFQIRLGFIWMGCEHIKSESGVQEIHSTI
jgi:hypothetical protein